MALVLPYGDKSPKLGRDVWLAPSCTIIGDVTLDEEANVWFGAVIRGDIGAITIGARTNVQDLACIHLTEGLSTTKIGADVTIGHGAILHGCEVGDGCLIGMGSVILDNAVIGAEAIIAAGSVVPPRMKVPPRALVRGNPGKVFREASGAELEMGRVGAAHYVENARRFREILAHSGAADGTMETR